MDYVRSVALIGMFAAASFLLMAAIQIPILPAASYLRYDPSDVIGLITAFTLGPASAILVVALKDLLYLFFRAKSIFGPLANLIAVGTFVGVAGWIYQKRQQETLGWLLGACGAGALARVLVMIPANLVILHLQLGLSASKVVQLLWPVIIPFNSAASVLNAVLSVVLLLAVKRRGLTFGQARPQ